MRKGKKNENIKKSVNDGIKILLSIIVHFLTSQDSEIDHEGERGEWMHESKASAFH